MMLGHMNVETDVGKAMGHFWDTFFADWMKSLSVF